MNESTTVPSHTVRKTCHTVRAPGTLTAGEARPGGNVSSERQQGWGQKKTVRSRERHRTPKGHAKRVVWLTTANEWKVVWIRW